MQLSSGLICRPQRVVIYGPEGIGKSTIAAEFPDPVFVDVEQGTAHLDVFRTPPVTSWRMYLDQLGEFVADQHGRKTLVIDTVDFCEKLAVEQVMSENQLNALGGNNDFGHSYNLLAKEWDRSLDVLSRIRDAGMHIVLLAHAKMRKFELPEEGGAFDRWELKLEKKTASSTREWADMVLFANYKTYVVDQDGSRTKKARGGKRVMHMTHHPCWDAKNRHGLPDECELGFSPIAKCFGNPTPSMQPSRYGIGDKVHLESGEYTVVKHLNPKQSQAAAVTPPQPTSALTPLLDLMRRDSISEHEVQLAVAKRGYYPADTPLENYDPAFVAGKLVSHWDIVKGTVLEIREQVTA